VKLTNVSNPAAFGVEFRLPDSGTRVQLVNIRGTASLMLGMERPGGNGWANTPVVAPERFGMRDAPRNFREFLKIAEAYTAAATQDDE